MRNSALRQRLFQVMLLFVIYSMATAVFAQDHHGPKDQEDQQGQQSDDEHEGSHRTRIMWINHLDLVPGDPSVLTSFNAVSSGVGGGLSGLIITSSTTGDTANGGGNKVVEKGLQVPPGYIITGVRICYELSNVRSFIDQIRLAQVQDPPSTALVRLDDATHLTSPDPVCANSAPTTVDPELGAVRLDLRVNFGNTSDKIVVRALALHLERRGE